jgi:hypothetical protein
MKKPLPLWLRESGRLYELHILLAILLVSVAVGFGRYSKHGLLGFAAGFVITGLSIILGGAALIFAITWIARIHEHLAKFGAYRTSILIIGHLFRLLMLMGFGAFSWMLIAMRFGWDSLWDHRFIPIMTVITGIILFIIHQWFRDNFWQGFRIFCGGLLFTLLGSVFGLVLEPVHWHLGPLAGSDLGAVIGLLLYAGGLVWLRLTRE